MALPAEIYKKHCIRTEWHVAVTGAKKLVQSPSFSLETSKWVFEFETYFNYNTEEMFKLKFVKLCQNKMPERFLLTSQLRCKDGRIVFLSYNQIESKEVEIMNIYRDGLFQSYPEVDFSQNRLKFVFTVDYGIRSFQDYKQGDHECLENLSLDYSKLMDDGSNPDVRLKCGDCTIPAHRLILGARSEVFRAMLQTDMQEGREGSVEIVDMDSKVLQIFIRYLYTGLIPELGEETALPLYEAADKYHVNALKARCSVFLARNLKREKACEILATADAHSDKDLKERVISYILEEKIPNVDDMWTKFCDNHPKLAIEVLRRFYKQSVGFL